MITAYLLDDEELALQRLRRLLDETKRVTVIGSNTDPVQAVEEVRTRKPDVLFLDINMPGWNGFDVLARLDPQPLVIFTTAYSEFALKAFEVNSVDYLVKPVDREALGRALGKVERIVGKQEAAPDLAQLLTQLQSALPKKEFPKRIASKLGDKVELLELREVTHFFAKEKFTFAMLGKKEYIVEETIASLEEKLDPAQFVRVHRSALLNLDHVKELHSWFAGRMVARLKDGQEVSIARERVKELRVKLGL